MYGQRTAQEAENAVVQSERMQYPNVRIGGVVINGRSGKNIKSGKLTNGQCDHGQNTSPGGVAQVTHF